MANTIGEGDRNLVRLDYISLLTAILAVLQNPQRNNPYKLSENGKQLCIDIDEIAYALATAQDSKIQMPLSSWQGARVATTNFTESSRDDFANYNRKIRDSLQQHLESFVKEQNFDSIENYISNLGTNLLDFQGEVGNKISFDYDFDKKYSGLSKQRLTLKHDDYDSPILKFHRLTISIKDTKGEFDSQLKDSINNYINCEFDTSSNKDELEEILVDLHADREKTDSDWYALKRLMDTEAIALMIILLKLIFSSLILHNHSKNTIFS